MLKQNERVKNHLTLVQIFIQVNEIPLSILTRKLVWYHNIPLRMIFAHIKYSCVRPSVWSPNPI